jgi:hypothetical protein
MPHITKASSKYKHETKIEKTNQVENAVAYCVENKVGGKGLMSKEDEKEKFPMMTKDIINHELSKRGVLHLIHNKDNKEVCTRHRNAPKKRDSRHILTEEEIHELVAHLNIAAKERVFVTRKQLKCLVKKILFERSTSQDPKKIPLTPAEARVLESPHLPTGDWFINFHTHHRQFIRLASYHKSQRDPIDQEPVENYTEEDVNLMKRSVMWNEYSTPRNSNGDGGLFDPKLMVKKLNQELEEEEEV